MAFSVLLGVCLLSLFVTNMYFVYKQHWDYIFSLIFILLLFIPSDLTGFISGHSYSAAGKINIGIVGYDVVIVLICVIIKGKGMIKLSKRTIGLVGFFVMLFIWRAIVNGEGVLSNKLLDNYFIPILLALMICTYMSTEIFPSVMRTIVMCIVINALVACIEVIIGKSLFLHEYYMKDVAWYQGIYNFTMWGVNMRGCAFLGHPLVNGMYYVIAIAYVYNCNFLKRKYLKIVSLTILIGGIWATNSRGALIIFVGYTLLYFCDKKNYMKLSVLLLSVSIVLAATNFNELNQLLFSRDTHGDSIFYRIRAIYSIFKISIERWIFGVGFNNVPSILKQIGMSGNFEISYLIILLENGIIGFLIWLMGLAKIYCKKMIGNTRNSMGSINVKKAINGMIICMLSLATTGNYFGDPGTLNYMLWSLFAFSRVMKQVEINNK